MHKLYGVVDKIDGEYLTVFHAKNDGMAIRSNLPALSRVRPVDDLEFYQIGTFDENSGLVSACPPRSVPKDSYKFPETPPDPKENEKGK